MIRRDFLKQVGIAGAITAVPVEKLFARENPVTQGIIGGRIIDENKKGVYNVKVSDGFNITTTDKKGNYKIKLHSDAEFVFMSVPSGYQIPHEAGLARFYVPVNKISEAGAVNFSITKNELDDTKHALVIWADPQIIKDKDAVELINVSAPDTAAHVKTLGHIPVHGITVGDLVHDRFGLYEQYIKAIAEIGIPFFQLIGNHDMDYTARTDEQSENSFKSLFGPTYFSFDRGKIHYVVMDDVFYIGKGHSFIGYLAEEQLSWLEKDLKYVPEGSTVIINMHIPTNTGEKKRSKLKEELMNNVLLNREHLYSLLKNYTVHFMSGHTHWNEKWEKDNMTEHNHGTVCGAWWADQKLAMDGTPNGYAVYLIDNTTVSWYYKSVGFPKEYQLKVYPPGRSVEKPQSVVANVWNFDPKWHVEYFEDGISKGDMEQFIGEDPDVAKHYISSYKRPTEHLFAAIPAGGTKEFMVRVTDRFGTKYESRINL